MFLLSVKLSPKRIAVGALAVVAAVGLTVTGVNLARGKDKTAVPTIEAAQEQKKPKKVTAKTAEERLAFAQSFGWEVEAEPAEVLEVIIPEEFDQVYMEYNAIQQKQGYDLQSYAGKRCKRYSYIVTNYPGEEAEVRFNLLLYNNKVIGGDVCSTRADGFMHGFAAE